MRDMKLLPREIKRNVLAMYGIEGLSDKQLDECLLYGDDKNGLVVRFKAALRTKDWRITQVVASMD